MRKLVSVLTALTIAALLVACTPDEASHLDAVNAFRAEHGVPALQWEEGAYAKARAWSQKMANDGRLSHSRLSAGIPTGWRTLGENVAVHGSLEAAMDALERSPDHRANMLNRAFKKIAVGVIHQNGRYWVTQVFIG